MTQNLSKYFWFNNFEPDVKIDIADIEDERANTTLRAIMFYFSLNITDYFKFIKDPKISKILDANVYYISYREKKKFINHINKKCKLNISPYTLNLQIYFDDFFNFILIEAPVYSDYTGSWWQVQKYHLFKNHFLREIKYRNPNDFYKEFCCPIIKEIEEFLNDYDIYKSTRIKQPANKNNISIGTSKYWFDDFKPDENVIVSDIEVINHIRNLQQFPTSKYSFIIYDVQISEILKADVYYINPAKKKSLIKFINKKCGLDIDECIFNLQLNLVDGETNKPVIFVESARYNRVSSQNILSNRRIYPQYYYSFKNDYLRNNPYRESMEFRTKFIEPLAFEINRFLEQQ